MTRQTTPARPPDRRPWLRTETVQLAVALAVLVWMIGEVLLMAFAGILLAVGLDGISRPLGRYTSLARGWALLIVGVLILALLIAAGTFIIPQFIQQLTELWERLLEFLGAVEEDMPWLQGFLDAEENMDVQAMLGQVASFTFTAVGGLATLIIMLVIALFAAVDPGLYRRGIVALVPPTRRDRAEESLSKLGYALRWWLLGQLFAMLMLGTTTALMLLMLGIELWLGLGVLVGLLAFIPFLGPIVAGVPVVLIGFSEGVTTGLLVLAFYLVIQNVEGNILTPMIQQRAIRLPPVMLVIVQVLLGTLFGGLGLILASPLAVVVMVLVNLLYVQDVLGEPGMEIGDKRGG